MNQCKDMSSNLEARYNLEKWTREHLGFVHGIENRIIHSPVTSE